MSLAHEVRPPATLQLTMDYLVVKVVNMYGQVAHGDWYDFLWDRMRSVRKDITVQHLCTTETVDLVEKCARWAWPGQGRAGGGMAKRGWRLINSGLPLSASFASVTLPPLSPSCPSPAGSTSSAATCSVRRVTSPSTTRPSTRSTS